MRREFKGLDHMQGPLPLIRSRLRLGNATTTIEYHSAIKTRRRHISSFTRARSQLNQLYRDQPLPFFITSQPHPLFHPLSTLSTTHTTPDPKVPHPTPHHPPPITPRQPPKMTLTQTLLHLTNFKSPLLATLVPSVAAAYAIQTACALPSIALQSEHFYDLSGSLTYLAVTALSLSLPALRARAAAGGVVAPLLPTLLRTLTWRQVVLSGAVGLWAARCTFPHPPRLARPV